MKLKNLFIGLSSLLLLGAAFALVPNIPGRGSTITSLDPTTNYIMVQSGTSQNNITAYDFSTSISGDMVDYIDGILQGIAGGLHFVGTRDASTGVFPGSPSTGDFYIINHTGTIETIDFDVGDEIVANKFVSGATNSGDWLIVEDVEPPETDPVWLADSGNYVPRANIDTGFNNTGSNTIIPSEKAIVDYISGALLRNYIGGLLSSNIGAEHKTKIGHYGSATGSGAISLGGTAAGELSTAGGISTQANGQFSTTFGFQSIAGGDNSFAAGYGPQALGNSSIALGKETVAIGGSAMSIGQRNVGITGAIFEIGIGTQAGSGANAITVLNDGSVGIGTTGPGYTLELSGDMFIGQGPAQVGGFLLDVLGHRVGLYGGIVGMTTGASVYGQTDVGVAGHFESLGAGTGLDVVSLSGVGAIIQGATMGLIVDGNVSISGELYSTILRQENTRHAFGGFQLQTTTIDITSQSGRKMITNGSGNLRTGLEAFGLSLSGDIMTVLNTGDYAGTLSISVSGPNNDDVCIRLFNITSSGQVGYFICGTTLGLNNYTVLSMPLYLEDDANDQFRMEIANITNNADVNVRTAVFYIHYLHD